MATKTEAAKTAKPKEKPVGRWVSFKEAKVKGNIVDFYSQIWE